MSAAVDVLLDAAGKEPCRVEISDLGPVIALLRDERGFSFQSIADWLVEHGVSCRATTAGAVYKRYSEGREKLL